MCLVDVSILLLCCSTIILLGDNLSVVTRADPSSFCDYMYNATYETKSPTVE